MAVTTPTVGGDDGTWGTVLNSALTSLDTRIEDLATTYAKGTNVQVFYTNGTWTKPAGAKSVDIIAIGAGTGGASGRRGAPGTVRQGGGGGSSSGVTRYVIPADALPATVAVTVGAGTAGGAAITTDDTDGQPSAVNSATTFGAFIRIGTNQAVTNQAGTTGAGGAGAAAGAGVFNGSNGAAASATGGVGANAAAVIAQPGAGGAGGGITTANVANNGGQGGNAYTTISVTMTGGVVDGALPVTRSHPAGAPLPGHGGGGGAASITTHAQAGADGGLYGAGGGGGGASTNGFNSGAGGKGAPGIVVVTTYF
jgi:hypothetical protein